MDIKKIKKLPLTVVGIAPNAWPRIVASSLVENYSIVCMRYRRDTALISNDVKLLCVEKDFPEQMPLKANAHEALKTKGVQNYINSLNDRYLLMYKSTAGTEKVAAEFGWPMIGTPIEIKDKFENKKYFREALVEAGIDPIPGVTYPVIKFVPGFYKELRDSVGNRMVFQLTEMTEGGGVGTDFINNEDDYSKFVDKLKLKAEERKGNPLEYVNVTNFIDGISSSITGCVTKNGILTTRIQCQIQDIEEVRLLYKGSGLFCGHDWSFRDYGDNIQKQAIDIAKKFGEYIQKQGYRGIFGLDLLVDENAGVVYPVECNPRYTDAFPILSMIYMDKGITPLDYYHIAEFSGVDLNFDADVESKNFNIPLQGAQVILETKNDNFTQVLGEVRAGIYKYESERLEYIRPGYRYEHLLDDSEYLITEGVPQIGTIQKPNSRILRLISKKGFLQTKNSLKPEISEIIEKIYQMLQLHEIETPKEYQDDN